MGIRVTSTVDRTVLNAGSMNGFIRRGTLRDVRFLEDGSISPFIEIDPRTHIACNHKWAFPFISAAERNGLTRPGAVMTLWEKHAREDFGSISQLPPAPRSRGSRLADFKYAAQHLSRVNHNTALIASGLVSEIIVVYAMREAVFPLFGRQWSESFCMPHYLSHVPMSNGGPFWTIMEHNILPSSVEIPIHFCLPQAYPATLRAVFDRQPDRSLLNNYDLDLFTTNTIPPGLLTDTLEEYPRIKREADAIKQADYNVVCTSTEMFHPDASPDNTPKLAMTILETVASTLG